MLSLPLFIVVSNFKWAVKTLLNGLIGFVEQIKDGFLCVTFTLLKKGLGLLDRVLKRHDLGWQTVGRSNNVSEVDVSVTILCSKNSSEMTVVFEDFT